MNLASVIEGHPDDAAAIVSRGRTTTYGELRAQVAALRGGLAAQGLVPGARVAVVAANNRTFVWSYLAALGAGCVVVPLNPASPAAELERQLRLCSPHAVVVGPTGRAAFASIDRAALADLQLVVAPEGVDLPGAVALESLLDAAPVPVVDRAGDDLAVLASTAGTAGVPKAAMLTHGNLLANLQQVQAVPGRRVVPDDVSYGALPLFHIYGLNVVLGLALVGGSTLVLVERFHPLTALDDIREHGCTIVSGAPPMWVAWATVRGADPTAFRTVRLAASGAAKLPVDVAATMLDRFGVQVTEGYGLTEASPVVTTQPPGGPFRPDSIGRPVPGVEIRLVDDGRDALLGDPGEIWVRGPNVFAGYWDDPDATATALTDDGWLRTGDVAVADDDGELVLVDRLSDLIIVSGFNVYPAEVERVLLEHRAIEAVAVVGVDDPVTGEAVKAYVVTEGDLRVDEEEILAWCASRIARYKCPTRVAFVEEIPVGLTGKIVRRELR